MRWFILCLQFCDPVRDGLGFKFDGFEAEINEY